MSAVNARCAVALLPLALLLSACVPLRGNRVSPASLLIPGQRVRLTVPESRDYTQTGTLVALSGDSVTMLRVGRAVGRSGPAEDTVRQTLALGAVFRLEVSRGRPRREPYLPAVGGAALGGALGVLVVWAAQCGGDETMWCEPDTKSPAFRWTVFGAAAAGSIVGGLMGCFRAERWAEVPKELLYHVRIGLAPLPSGRLGLSAALRF